MEEFDKEKLDEYSIEDLELYKSGYKAKQESGEVLLEAILKTPFKKPEKVKSIMNKISQNKGMVTYLSNAIRQKEQEKNTDNTNHGLTGGLVWTTGGTAVWSTNSGTIAYSNAGPIGYSFNTKLEKTMVKYVDEYNEVKDVEVVDDIFQSVLGNYYLIYMDGVHLPLNRVIEFEEESNVGRWYERMRKNFERGSKLERILKDDDNEEDS
jgi:hypothetical protein